MLIHELDFILLSRHKFTLPEYDINGIQTLKVLPAIQRMPTEESSGLTI